MRDFIDLPYIQLFVIETEGRPLYVSGVFFFSYYNLTSVSMHLHHTDIIQHLLNMSTLTLSGVEKCHNGE